MNEKSLLERQALKNWDFTGKNGDFQWESPDSVSRLYFPLCNEKGMMTSITPSLHGDIKTGHDRFLTPPVTVEDLHNARSGRNFWLFLPGYGPWSVVGVSASQHSHRFSKDDTVDVKVEAGMLWHKVTYTDKHVGLKSTVLNFVPIDDNVEIMKITISNIGESARPFTPTSAVPLFCRSADNIRDHRHVTGLVNRYVSLKAGFMVKPVIQFDERRHRDNPVRYYCMGITDEGKYPVQDIPLVEDFIGPGGDFEWPRVIVCNDLPERKSAEAYNGKEYIGALRFEDDVIKPGEQKTFIIFLGITEDEHDPDKIIKKYKNIEKVTDALSKVKKHWSDKISNPLFHFQDTVLSNWVRWVGLQPVLRTVFGNSYLPYHDYGKGGKGWRDLWQDLLAVILHEPASVKNRLIGNFAGVRIDGTNATIIGENNGKFLADRNNIPRVWMDHGAWPWLTVKLYLDQTGDFSFLFEQQKYFQDALQRRAEAVSLDWSSEKGTQLLTSDGKVYKGSILEHLLVQHLTSFHNVGQHNLIRLENADWNDAIDLASEKGESVPFTVFYAANLIEIAKFLRIQDACQSIEIFKEFLPLLCSETRLSSPEKVAVLKTYFDSIENGVSGNKISLSAAKVADLLESKGRALIAYVRENEWVQVDEECGFFNSYYDNEGSAVGGVFGGKVVMELIGQVFCVMSGTADYKQTKMICRAAEKFLRDPDHGGYRLNTRYRNEGLNFGRVSAFSYGEKENGATFSHMVIMFVNALYKQGFASEAARIFRSLYELSIDSEKSCIYPGVPEYFTPEGRGMYPYLTGTASWLMLTLLQYSFGIKGVDGNLCIEPGLTSFFFSGKENVSVDVKFAGFDIKIIFDNPQHLDYNEYRSLSYSINGDDFQKALSCRILFIRGKLYSIMKKRCTNIVHIRLER